MELKGKKINFLGDSITEGVGATDPEAMYVNIVKHDAELAEARNYGISGTRIARQSNDEGSAYCDRYKKMDDDADVVVVFGGTNDFGHGDAPLGTMADRTPDTFYGALHCLYTALTEKYPDVPYFLMGHSMGSFLTRTYLIRYPGTVDAAIIMGTGHQSPAVVAGGRAIAGAAGKRHGFDAHSPRVENLAFGAYNKAFAPNRTEVDWLSVSENNVDAYIADPLCGQKASIGLFYEMLGGIRFVSAQKNINSMNLNTPILFIAGDKDPVGEMGKGVRRAYNAFRRAGVRDLELKLYEGLRHEILNEDCRAVVYNDLWSRIEKHL